MSNRAAEKLGWQPIPDVPRRFRRLLAKADDALGRYLEDGEIPDLGQVVETLDRVVADARFAAATAAFRQAMLNRTAIAHNWHGIMTGTVADIETSVRLLTEGLPLAPDGSPEQARMDCNLGSNLLHLYREHGDPAFLADAADHLRRSSTSAGADATLVALCRSHLASVLHAQFMANGEVSALSEAIELAELCLSEGPSRFDFRYTLATLLFSRYDIHGGLDDLDRAIGLLREARGKLGPDAVAGKTRDHDETMGAFLRSRYLRTRDPADLEEAIRLQTKAVDRGEYRDLTSLTGLGNALLTRYHDFGDEDDVFTAVDLHQRELAGRSPGDWSLAGSHNNLANALDALSRVTGDPEPGERALGHYRTALHLTQENAPDRTARLYNLGRVLQARSELTGDAAMAAEAADFYRNAVRHGLNASLEWALSAGRAWGEWATRRESWDEACTAYDAALEATRRLFRSQVLRADRETWLADSQGLPAAAAYAMFRAGRLEDAVLALESGRSLLLSEVLERERAGLDRLAGTDHAELVERYRAATTALDGATWQGAEPGVLRAHRDAVDEAIEAIRGVAGYERFLRAPTISDVRDAITAGTVVVYLAAAPPAGVALAVGSDGQVRAVELPAATAAAVRHRADALLGARRLPLRAGRWEGALDAVTRWCWPAIMAPVRSLAGAGRQIVLVPSGSVTMLPLHAAWTPDPDTPGARHYALDQQPVTYAPNARSLQVTGRIAARTPAAHLAVIADPRPTSWEPIGYTRAETAWARHWFPTSDVLQGEQADRAAVLTALATAQVHHFICHGKAHPDEPLESALVLAGDDELTLREILALRLSESGAGARLVVLSACDTDQPGRALPDEVVSLPTGLIQAGVAGVVATRWAVRSEAVSLLIARFYQLWQGEGQPPPTALQVAQRWLRDTTNREKARDLAVAVTPAASPDLVGLIRALHLRDPDERAYWHPADWAALSYHGS